MLTSANLQLHKVKSNSVKVMAALPVSIRDLDLNTDPLLPQHSLGMCWDLEKDTFSYRVTVPEKPYTRRSVLAIVNAIYDPLGFATPATLKGRVLRRRLVAMGSLGMSHEQRFMPSPMQVKKQLVSQSI